MDRLLQVDREAFAKAMREEAEQIFKQVMDAVNTAPDGKVINGSEMQVRDLMGRLRQRVFERAVQMRIDSTESSFSPSQGRGGPGSGGQGSGFPQRAKR